MGMDKRDTQALRGAEVSDKAALKNEGIGTINNKTG